MRHLRDAWVRVLAGVWAAGQCGLAAAAAWWISTTVLGHSRPFFASVAAVVSLGLTAGGRLRRTAELSAGVTMGVAVGDLWVGLFGQGTWQIGVVVFLSLVAAVAVNGAGLAVSQAAIQACFVVALPRTPNSGFHRWQDALVGGACALLVAALLPPDPWKDARRLRTAYLSDLAGVLRDTAEAVRMQSSTAAAEALGRGRLLDPVLNRWSHALETGREAARISPIRRDKGDPRDMRLLPSLTRATRNLRVLVRRVTVALETGDSLPGELPELLDELANQLDPTTAADDAAGPMIDLAGRLDPERLGATSLSGQVVVAQLRVSLVDLLEGIGLDHDRAREALPVLRS
ncbi:MAG: rane protein-like protein [Frankiales bacterium]|nr:rane protein-like protein [Frankiales bacterium]